ncbi:MAG: glycosyltransferase [Pseudomonadota bacterium]
MDIQSCPERKNPWAHIRAWQAAFGDDPSKVLLMKIRAGKRTKVVLKELREMIGKARNIQILTQDFSAEEIERFQRMGDVFLSLHRSEGYGLVIHEMLMHGIPVLATDWSANHEFGPNYPNYFGVSYDLIPYSDWMHHYPGPSFKWADPSIQHAAGLLRDIADTRKAG